MNDLLSTLAPTVATLLGGPLAGIAIKFLADKLGAPAGTVNAVTSAMSELGTTLEGRIKLAEIDAALRTHALDIGVDIEKIDADKITAVNKTMQAESASEHWPTYSWRPFCGFVFGGMFLGVYFVLPMMRLPVPLVPFEAWTAMGAVLGVASWFRGKAQADPTIATNNKG